MHLCRFFSVSETKTQKHIFTLVSDSLPTASKQHKSCLPAARVQDQHAGLFPMAVILLQETCCRETVAAHQQGLGRGPQVLAEVLLLNKQTHHSLSGEHKKACPVSLQCHEHTAADYAAVCQTWHTCLRLQTAALKS